MKSNFIVAIGRPGQNERRQLFSFEIVSRKKVMQRLWGRTGDFDNVILVPVIAILFGRFFALPVDADLWSRPPSTRSNEVRGISGTNI